MISSLGMFGEVVVPKRSLYVEKRQPFLTMYPFTLVGYMEHTGSYGFCVLALLAGQTPRTLGLQWEIVGNTMTIQSSGVKEQPPRQNTCLEKPWAANPVMAASAGLIFSSQYSE